MIYLSIFESPAIYHLLSIYLPIYLPNTEFLSTVRNLFDPIRPSRSTNWTAASVDVPLESDAIALEYLSAYDYDVSKAYFNIFCDMGCGKGHTCMHTYIHSCIYIYIQTCMHTYILIEAVPLIITHTSYHASHQSSYKAY